MLRQAADSVRMRGSSTSRRQEAIPGARAGRRPVPSSMRPPTSTFRASDRTVLRRRRVRLISCLQPRTERLSPGAAQSTRQGRGASRRIPGSMGSSWSTIPPGGTVDVFDANFHFVKSFTDPDLPDSYAPFNVVLIGGRLFVTFAMQDADKE